MLQRSHCLDSVRAMTGCAAQCVGLVRPHCPWVLCHLSRFKSDDPLIVGKQVHCIAMFARVLQLNTVLQCAQ